MTETSSKIVARRKSLGLSRRKRFISTPIPANKNVGSDRDSSSTHLDTFSTRTCSQNSTDTHGTEDSERTTCTCDNAKKTGQNSSACCSKCANLKLKLTSTTSTTVENNNRNDRQSSSNFSSTTTHSDVPCHDRGVCLQSPSSTPTAYSRPRTGLCRSGRKRLKTEIKLPIHHGHNGGVASGDTNTKEQEEKYSKVDRDLESLREESSRLQQEIDSLRAEGLNEAELKIHMRKMHEYNELKDMGQMLLGKIAVIEGVTTKDLYSKYALDLDD